MKEASAHAVAEEYLHSTLNGNPTTHSGTALYENNAVGLEQSDYVQKKKQQNKTKKQANKTKQETKNNQNQNKNKTKQNKNKQSKTKKQNKTKQKNKFYLSTM